jgi:hypothetical protein
MNYVEAMKQALEALEQSQTKAPFGADGVVYSKGVKIHEAAITALRTAIAEAEKQEPCGWQFYQNGEWNNGMETNNHRENTEAAGIPTRNVYPAAQPVVPTKEMIDAAERIDWADSDVRGNIINMWQAMTAAAPAAAPVQEPVELVRIEHWRQDTTESGHWEKTREMPRHIAERLLHHFDQASIITVAPEKGTTL